jgi:hypothetical protein
MIKLKLTKINLSPEEQIKNYKKLVRHLRREHQNKIMSMSIRRKQKQKIARREGW